MTERFVNDAMVMGTGNRTFLARMEGVVIGTGVGWLLGGTVGIFGIAVAEQARRRGVGAALTLSAALAFGDDADLAWLHPSAMARSLYASLGFRTVAEWEVWIRDD